MATPTFQQLQSSPGNALAILVTGQNPDGTVAAPSSAPLPANFIAQTANGAASAISATLTVPAGRQGYISGFQVTGGGATAGQGVTVSVSGVLNTPTYQIFSATGVSTNTPPLIVSFVPPLPATSAGVNIVVNVTSFGAGNTTEQVSVQGFLV